MMKKVVFFLIIFCFCFYVVGCSSSASHGANGNSEFNNAAGKNDENAEIVCQHTYDEPTCTRASKCTKCGETNGTYGSHSYSNGVCLYCGGDDPDYNPVLTGSEYQRVNAMLEGTYQYRISTGNLVEYNFKGGSFVCYTQIGDTIVQNNGTYSITEKTLELLFQNGTRKNCSWDINKNGELELYLLEL